MSEITLNYSAADAPTLQLFHRCLAPSRCIVGPVGSGKTSAAAWDTSYYLPWYLYKRFGIVDTRGLIVRNTYSELIDTTQKTVFDWFSWGKYKAGEKVYTLKYPQGGPEIEILFRSCDRPEDIKKFKSLEITWAWLDESIEIPNEIKLMLKNRIGRYPPVKVWIEALRTHCPELQKLSDDEVRNAMEANPDRYPTRFFIETTNPPDVEHPLYSQYNWQSPPPGPLPTGTPLKGHIGFWQKAGENEKNLRPNYYNDLRADYALNPDWISTYIDGKPGVILQGKAVYNNFIREYHVAKEPLVWSKGTIYRGWDHSGNTPACVVLQIPTAGQVQVLKEFTSEKLGIIDFARVVNVTCNQLYPNAKYIDWGDPAGAAQFSKREGGFTSNSQLIQEATQINIVASEQNFLARKESVEQQLRVRDGFLIDPSCTRLINGFVGGYCYPEIGRTGVYVDAPVKNRFSHCLSGETLVATPKGDVPIMELRPGDKVITPDGVKRITATMNSISSDLLLIKLSNGRELICTKDHPFITEKGIVLADSLGTDDNLEVITIYAAGNFRRSAARITQKLPLTEQRRVYDLTVEDAHCFYANNVLVSNCHDALQYVLVKLFRSEQAGEMAVAEARRLYKRYRPPSAMSA